jgi:hypothetical protein
LIHDFPDPLDRANTLHALPLLVVSVLCLFWSVVMFLASRSAEQLAVPGQSDYHHWSSVSSLRTAIGGAFGAMVGVCYASLFAANRLAARLGESEGRIAALEAELRKLRGPGDA